MLFYLETILKILSIILPLLIAIAYFTLAERKIMAAIQRRKGPNVVGFLGLLQPLADGLKLILKETTIPSNANKILFNIAPILTFFLSLLGWAVIPFGEGIVLSDINLGLMYLFAISSLGVYGVIIAGWSSNSKYAFLGALRSAAQMISYELSMGFIIINIVILTGSFNLSDIVLSQNLMWYALPQLPMFAMFFVCTLAETNRHPFDLMEAEAELVSGFNVEYAAVGFAMFFLGEYGNILLMCSLSSILFLGGWQAPIELLNFIPGPLWFGVKIAFFVILFIWVRAAFPRYRYDQLMRLGWKIFLPLSLGYLIFTTGIHSSFYSNIKEFDPTILNYSVANLEKDLYYYLAHTSKLFLRQSYNEALFLCTGINLHMSNLLEYALNFNFEGRHPSDFNTFFFMFQLSSDYRNLFQTILNLNLLENTSFVQLQQQIYLDLMNFNLLNPTNFSQNVNQYFITKYSIKLPPLDTFHLTWDEKLLMQVVEDIKNSEEITSVLTQLEKMSYPNRLFLLKHHLYMKNL